MRIATAAFAVLYCATPLQAQAVRLGVHGVYASIQETQAARKWDGFGVGGVLELHKGRVTLELDASRTSLQPADTAVGTAFTLVATAARVSIRAASLVSLEVATGHQRADPTYAATDLGYVQVGLVVASPIAQHGRVWARAAYLPVTRFNSGGSSVGLAVATGFGADIVLKSGRLWASSAYQFLRFDRTGAPLQRSFAWLGVVAGL